MTRLYTVGYEGRTQQAIITALADAGIAVACLDRVAQPSVGATGDDGAVTEDELGSCVSFQDRGRSNWARAFTRERDRVPTCPC